MLSHWQCVHWVWVSGSLLNFFARNFGIGNHWNCSVNLRSVYIIYCIYASVCRVCVCVYIRLVTPPTSNGVLMECMLSRQPLHHASGREMGELKWRFPSTCTCVAFACSCCSGPPLSLSLTPQHMCIYMYMCTVHVLLQVQTLAFQRQSSLPWRHTSQTRTVGGVCTYSSTLVFYSSIKQEKLIVMTFLIYRYIVLYNFC